MSVSCVIVGLIRSDALFEQSLITLDRLRSEGLVSRIIISTWNEELRDNPSVSLFANKYNCDLVSRPDPGMGHGPGSELTSSMAPQTLGLRQALMAVDDDDMVLKMRPDVVLNENFLRNLLLSSCTASFDAASGSPFKKRVWVPWADLMYPFLIADEVFLGRCGDLKLLATDFYLQYSAGKAVHPHAETCHILRYLAPFESGVFADFFKNWVYLQYELPVVPGGWTEYFTIKFKTPMWWVMIAKYASILCDNFIIDGGRPRDIVFFRKSGDRTHRSAPKEICHFYPGTMIPVAIKANAFIENITSIRARVLILNDMEWLKNLRYGNLQSDAYYDSWFLPAIAQMQQMESRGQVPDLRESIIETIRNLKGRDIDLSALSHPDWQIHRLSPSDDLALPARARVASR
jgi:hypothetical protein